MLTSELHLQDLYLSVVIINYQLPIISLSQIFVTKFEIFSYLFFNWYREC